MEELVIKRNPNPKPTFTIMKDIMVEKGTIEDWYLLRNLHYKAHILPVGPKFYKLTLHGETIGVLVMSSPKLLLKERHLIFPKLGSGGNSRITNQMRAKWINKNMRIISRLVLDTRFRGIGLGYRFQNIASRMENIKYIEIQSSMSKYNMFATKAGFKFVKPMRSNFYDKGMEFFKKEFKSNPANYVDMLNEFRSLSPEMQEQKIERMKEFYECSSAMEQTGDHRFAEAKRVYKFGPERLLKYLQQLVLASPLYGIYENPDYDRELPDKIPVLAFDNQDTRTPLKL